MAGKYLGYAAMIVGYVALTFLGTVAVGYAVTGILPEHPARGFLLIAGECVLVLGVTFMLGTWFSTLTTGVLALGFQGLAFMGGWLEQVSGFSQSAHRDAGGGVEPRSAQRVAVAPRRVRDADAARGLLSFSPFANVSIPSDTAVVYAAVYLAAVLGLTACHFARRDL